MLDGTAIYVMADVLPWIVQPLETPKPDGWFAFNPSIHWDGQVMRCAIRVADYGMPGGAVVTRTPGTSTTHVKSKLVMAVLDPDSLRVTFAKLAGEHDGQLRAPCSSAGFEDVRIFCTESYGLCGIAASLQIAMPSGESAKAVEQVLLTFDRELDIVSARPIRGGSWSGSAQKNWSPFDGTPDPLFLYSIERGTLFDELGALDGQDRERTEPKPKPKTHVRPMINAAAGSYVTRAYQGLRGGTQLVYLGDAYGDGQSLWLGCAHEMRIVSGRKLYWHIFYAVDQTGKFVRRGPCVKLAAEGIEFAAGLVVMGDRVLVSFGVDDSECRIGTTSLTALLQTLAATAARAET